MEIKATYSQLVMPDHINNVGTLFGGQMMSWMDMAAAKAAYRFLKGTEAWGAVTRAIQEVQFKEPVYAGEWLTFTGKITDAGNTSISIRVDAYAEGRMEAQRHACSALIIMVAVRKDEDGKFVKYKHGKKAN